MDSTAGALIENGDSDMPRRVQSTVDFFRRSTLWYRLTRNSVATSCKDAAARRQRLGKEGIPIYDELRSFCGAAYYSDGSRKIVLLHCRANSHFDMEAAVRLLGATKRIARLSPDELSRDKADYGTVNPFSEPAEYVQVFDEDVLNQYTPPHTMMTNAGAHTWAVEFRPADVIGALRQASPGVLVGRITIATGVPKRIPVIGIITGNGPESGIALWRYMNEEIHKRLKRENRMRGDLSYPKVVVLSIPEMGLSMELEQREQNVWEVIRGGIEELVSCGVSHLALACNTTQYRIRAMCEPSVRFVSMVDVTSDYIRREHLNDITIIGIPTVASLGQYSAYAPLRALDVHAVEEHARPHMEELAYLVKQLDAASPDNKSLNRLQHVIRSGVRTSRVLIALTEVSVLLERFPRLRQTIGGKAVIDPLQLCGTALAEIYLRSLPREEVQELPTGE